MNYDNNQLVKLVKTSEYYLKFKSPRDEKVLEAMRKVDRKDFLPSMPGQMDMVEPMILNLAQQCSKDFYQLMNASDSGYEIGPGLRATTLERLINASKLLIESARHVILNSKELAYNDIPIKIGEGKNCSQPSLIGLMNDVLELQEGMKVLEIGAGCGYHAATVSHMI